MIKWKSGAARQALRGAIRQIKIRLFTHSFRCLFRSPASSTPVLGPQQPPCSLQQGSERRGEEFQHKLWLHLKKTTTTSFFFSLTFPRRSRRGGENSGCLGDYVRVSPLPPFLSPSAPGVTALPSVSLPPCASGARSIRKQAFNMNFSWVSFVLCLDHIREHVRFKAKFPMRKWTPTPSLLPLYVYTGLNGTWF